MPKTKTTPATPAPAPVKKVAEKRAPAPEHTAKASAPPPAKPTKRVGLRQRRIERAGVAYKVAMNEEGVWSRPVTKKHGQKWAFLAWDEIIEASPATNYEPTGDEQ